MDCCPYVGSALLAVVIIVGFWILMPRGKKPSQYSPDTVVVHGFAPVFDIPGSASPFCLKLLTWLKLVGIPFVEAEKVGKPPHGKFPFITHQGKSIPDSSTIIEYISKCSPENEEKVELLDGSLTEKQEAISELIKSSLEEHLYFISVYSKWVDPVGWSVFYPALLDNLRSLVPSLMHPFLGLLARVIRRAIKKQLWEQGTGRHEPTEVYAAGIRIIDSIAVMLGGKKFIHRKVSSIDAIVFSFLATILYFPYDNALRKRLKSHENLTEFIGRLKLELFNSDSTSS